MKLWSIHPKYLDQKGLVICWSQAIICKLIIEGKIKNDAYDNHPQLSRFMDCKKPLAQINSYLYFLLQEAQRRNHKLDSSKIDFGQTTISSTMIVTKEQINSEVGQLFVELRLRDPKMARRLVDVKKFEPHPLFKIVPGKL